MASDPQSFSCWKNVDVESRCGEKRPKLDREQIVTMEADVVMVFSVKSPNWVLVTATEYY